jgi:hypothetical protein
MVKAFPSCRINLSKMEACAGHNKKIFRFCRACVSPRVGAVLQKVVKYPYGLANISARGAARITPSNPHFSNL